MAPQSLKHTVFKVASTDDSLFPGDGIERRASPRTDLPFLAVVRGVDAAGDRFLTETVIDNISGCGLYLRLPRPVEHGSKLLVIVQLSFPGARGVPGTRVALRGNIVRMEPQLDGRCGVAITFQHHRFLYASTA
jgi:hypothetical protein